MKTDKYILDDKGNPTPEPDLKKWAEWLETSGEARRVARTEVGEYHVSTVFLGIDYNFRDEGEPILFETMTFENKVSRNKSIGDGMPAYDYHEELNFEDRNFFRRYHTKAEAEAGHEQIVLEVKEYLKV